MLIAPEIQRRIDEASAEVKQHEEDDWELFRVPTANGVPQFEHARQATSKDFVGLGYVYRSRVVDAIEIMLKGRDETEPRRFTGNVSEVLES